MRSHLRSAAFSVLAAGALVGVLASPAGATVVGAVDGRRDVVDETGAAVIAPNVDIVAVELTNTTESLRVVVEVDEADAFAPVTFGPPPTDAVELTVALFDPTDPDRLWLTWEVSAQGFSTIGTFPSDDLLCATDADVDTTTDEYTLTADADCVRMLSRQLAVQAVTTQDDGTRVAQDAAPDDGWSGTASAGPSAAVSRIAGVDRMRTAIELSQADFDDDEAKAVVLASAANHPDALAGGPLATYRSAPVLLTGSASLDSHTLAEIDRVIEPGEPVYLLGGTAALAPSIESAVTAAGYTAVRLAGADRFETAVAIAEEIGAVRESVFVADGRSFTDALVAAAAAPSQRGVVVLTDGTTLPAATRDFLRTDTSDQIAIGTAAATAVGSTIHAIVGATPSELSVNVADEVTGVRGVIAVATDATFPDSLAGGPHIARLGGALLLTDPSTLSSEAGDAVEAWNGRLRQVIVFGGTAAVSDDVVRDVVAAL